MPIVLPEIPAGILTLLAFFGTYAVSFLNGVLPFVTKDWHKRVVTAVVAIALAAIVIVFYYFMTGDVLPSWPAFIILSLLVISAGYAVLRNSAKKVEARATKDDGVGL